MIAESGPPVETVRLDILSAGALDRAAELLARGQLVAFPTDTVYGVGAHAFIVEAVARLYLVKGRPAHLAIPLLLPDATALRTVCSDIPPQAWRLAEEFWPGGLSLILKRSAAVPDAATAGGPTVAVRVPDHPLILELCQRVGVPLAATSANQHGHPAPGTADAVIAELGGRIALVLDGGPCQGGLASTVLDLTVWPPSIRRRGPVSAEQLETVVPLAL
jgi:L-threonylcarbamoyladenylate synthase